jgi:hypothetical protein
MSNSITDRTFGIEIECFLNQDRGAFVDNFNAMSSDDRKNQSIHYAPDSYGSWLNDKWILGYDGTVRSTAENQRSSVELTSCPIKFSELDSIKPIIKKLGGATVNKNCGFHCHIDAKDLSIKDVKKIMINYLIYEEVIAFMHPYSRRWNAGYAASTRNVNTSQIDNAFRNATTNDLIKTIRRASNWERLFMSCSGFDPRYVKLNIKGLYQYHTRTGAPSGRTGTIEFRQHGGTVDQDKMIAWISFCYQMVESARYAKCDALQNDTHHVPFARKKRRLFDKIRKRLSKGFDSEEEFLDSYLFKRYTASRKFLIKRISWFMGPANRLTESERQLVNRTRLNGGTDVQ